MKWARWLNKHFPPTYAYRPITTKVYQVDLPLWNNHIPGAFRPAWIPLGLWKYDGTVHGKNPFDDTTNKTALFDHSIC